MRLEPERVDEIERKRMVLEQRFLLLQAPIREKRSALEVRHRLLQFFRDVEDELLWIDEKLRLATSDRPEDLGETNEFRVPTPSVSSDSSFNRAASIRLECGNLLLRVQLLQKKNRVR